MDRIDYPFHSVADTDEVFKRLGTNRDGLSSQEAAKRLQEYVAKAYVCGFWLACGLHMCCSQRSFIVVL